MVEKLHDIIARRIAIHPEYDFGINECWNEVMILVKEDYESVLSFVNSDASDEEVYWLSEKLCDMYDLTKDDSFVEAFKSRADKMTNGEMKRSILQEIAHI